MPDEKIRGIVTRMVEAGESEADIAAVIQRYRSAPQPQPSTADRLLADNPAAPWNVRAGLAVARGIKSHPTTAGAIAGGIAGAALTGGASIPASMLAAGGGGAVGAGAGRVAERAGKGEPIEVGDVARTALVHGVGQAAGQGAGALLAKGAGVIAPKLLKGILRPSRRVQEDFGDVIGTGLRERVPVGRSDVVRGRVEGSAREADGLIRQAEQAGAGNIPTSDVTQSFAPVSRILRERRQIGKPDELDELVDRGAALAGEFPNGIPLSTAQTLKRRAQNDASQVFRAIDAGNPVKDTTAHLDRAVATGLRRALESRVPEVGPINRRTQELMGLQEAMEAAEARSGGVTGMNPLNWVGGMAPYVGSNIAFGFNALSKAPLASGVRGVAALAAALMDQAKRKDTGKPKQPPQRR